MKQNEKKLYDVLHFIKGLYFLKCMTNIVNWLTAQEAIDTQNIAILYSLLNWCKKVKIDYKIHFTMVFQVDHVYCSNSALNLSVYEQTMKWLRQL